MEIKAIFSATKTILSVIIILSLFTSCSKGDIQSKRGEIFSEAEPEFPTTIIEIPVIDSVTRIDLQSLTNSEAKEIYNQSNIIIENFRFDTIEGIALNIKKSDNITIRNCFFNKATEEAINIEASGNITIENCLFNGVTTGVYALQSQTIKIRNNQFVNVRQRTNGGRGQFVQFNGVSGGDNAIENNKGENFPGESDPEDLISIFSSTGTAESPIHIRNNMFRGGGPSGSGGGIIAGDNGGGFTVIENNTLLNPGQYGIAAAGGRNITIINNKIFASQQPFTNNPLYVWAQADATCSDIYVTGNRVNWINKSGERNNGWNGGNCENTSFEYPTTISLDEMNVPEHLITMITPEELVEVRK